MSFLTNAQRQFACKAGDKGDAGSIPGLGRSPGGGNGNPLQSSCLENPMDRVAWQATVHGVAESWTRLNSGALSTSALTALLFPLVMVSPSLLQHLLFQDGAPFPHSWISITNSLHISQ